ncbi:MAG: flippase [Ardenticatenaceae bacterium]|nr:flippase [Ardenticatenaceae bacterium]
MSTHETRRLVNNFAFLTGGYFFVRLITMVATLYAARMLGPGDFGRLSSGVNIALVLAVTSNLGLADYMVLAIARTPQKSGTLLGDAFLIKVFVLPLILLSGALIKWIDPEHGLLFLLMILHGLFHSYILLFWAVFRGLERMEYQTFLMIIQNVIIAGGASLAIWLTKNATVAAVAYLLASGLTAVVGYSLLHKMNLQPSYRWRPDAWKQLLKKAFPFGLIFAYLIVYDKLPTILLPVLSPEGDAGWYNSVYTIVTVLATIPTIIMVVVFPMIARKSQNAQEEVVQISTSLIKYTTVIGLGLAIALAALAPWLIPFLFSDAYLPSIQIMQILAVSLPFLFLIISLTSIIEATGQQHICARYTGYALLLAGPLCVVFVWQWGYLGGSVAYVINNIVLTALMLRLVRKTIGDVSLGQAFWLPMMVGLVAGIFVYILRDWPFYILLAAALLLFLVLLLLSGVVGLPEVEMVRKVWQNRRLPQPAPASVSPVGNEENINLP